MKNLILTVIAVCSLNTIQAQEISYKKWVKEAPRLEDSFFTTPKAKEVAETVLLYQQPTGGWPKNINFFQTPDNKEKALEIKNDVNASTIDNGATTTEIIYLSRLYNATHDETYKEAAIRGLDYLFEAQYENGGWPQFYPRPKGYYVQITYNDNAMINVMNLLRDVSNGKSLSPTCQNQPAKKLRKQ